VISSGPFCPRHCCDEFGFVSNHFNQISEAPEAIRAFAFHTGFGCARQTGGTRVKRRTASQLFQRIQVEKARLLKAGEIKKQKPLSPIDPDEVPFGAPRGGFGPVFGR